MQNLENPFRITKSNNLVDEQIDQLWVSPGEGAEELTVRPTSPMAMFILGGKGSGKSHLMRHYSFEVQEIRFRKLGETILSGVQSDGYVGVYGKCGGLNTHRFSAKGLQVSRWSDLFAYYFEIWVADLTLAIVEVLATASGADKSKEIARDIANLFDAGNCPASSIRDIRGYLNRLRHQLDYTVNNLSIESEYNIEILVSRGRLFFGIPAAVCKKIPELSAARFVYLLDELENLEEEQQVFLNTLIRETEGPVSFKVGSRLYGLRTQRTLSGGERNREGSEYEELRLDERFRNEPSQYAEFARRLVARRLSSAFNNDVFEKEGDNIKDYFDEPDLSIDSNFLREIAVPSGNSERYHLAQFREKLSKGLADGFVVGPKTTTDADMILECVTFPQSPLIEKMCLLLIYQQWFRSNDLVAVAREAKESAEAYLSGDRGSKFGEFVNKHKGDMVAQLLRENSQRQIYAGFSTFVRMSEGLPRSLLTILKRIFDWSLYVQERPFSGGKFSLRAQERGVSEAADWFLDNMLDEGEAGLFVRSSVDRLSRLFRVNRFADKPIETSMIAFSVDDVQIEEEARLTLKNALDTSILIGVPRGQRERNSELVSRKLELNTMLSPRFDLPVARRGVASLSIDQANSIFVYKNRERFESLLRDWEARMTAPYFGRKAQVQRDPNQPDLFG